MTGYSDRINHAFAFAAKHHDRQVRKGTRLPYLTHPANVAIILTRYGCEEETVIAGILHDVIEDTVREAYSREMLEQRISEKFGAEVLATVHQVTHRRVDDDGVELSPGERKQDYLDRLAQASEVARWVCAADKLHNAASIVADLRRTDSPTNCAPSLHVALAVVMGLSAVSFPYGPRAHRALVALGVTWATLVSLGCLTTDAAPEAALRVA